MIKTFIKKEWVVITIVIAAFIVRVVYLSPWLEDWDSVQFALALKDFSIVKHQPHPPGYLVYVWLGRIINVFVKNESLSLTLLSALTGSLGALPLYLIIRDFANNRVAVFSVILFLVIPIHWTLSEVALTNIVGLSFLIASAYLLYRGLKSDKYLLIGSFLSGITIGVRFAEYSIVLSLFILVLIWRKKIKNTIKAIVLLFTGVVLWLAPIIVDTGFNQFITAYTNHVGYIIKHDSLLKIGTSLQIRLRTIYELFVAGYSPYFIVIILVTAWLLVRQGKKNQQFANIFAFIWLLSYLIPLVFIYNLEVPRHTLPLLPPLVLLVATSIANLKYKLLLPVYILITIVISVFSLQQIQKQKSLIPPSIAPVLFVKENFAPEDTTLITTFTFRQFQYYAPEFENHWRIQNVPENINSKTVILDYQQLKGQIPSLENYEIIEEITFEGPADIFPRLPKTNLYILERPSF